MRHVVNILMARSKIISLVFNVSHYFVLLFAFLVHTYCCLDISYFNYREILGLEGHVCKEEKRLFERVGSTVTGCLFECSSNDNCIVSAFVEKSNLCIGCSCESFRDISTLSHLDGATFYVQHVSTMFEGRCGSIEADDITVEYIENKNYSNKVCPTIRLDEWPMWVPEAEIPYFLKVDFKKNRLVRTIKTRGRQLLQKVEYVKTYSVYTSNDCSTKDFLETFTGNTDGENVAKVFLNKPVLTRCIYLKPETWTNYPILKIDFSGY